ELKTVSYHKLYDILKQHQNEVNEIRAERIARTANPLELVAQQQPVYHPHNHPIHYTQNSSTRSQQAVTRNRVNDQFLLQLQPEWKRFVTLVKLSQELKTILYHKLYDILKQHQNEVIEIRAERLACIVNPLALVAQQQPVYHPQNHPTHYTQNSLTKSQQAATRNKGKAIFNSSTLIYDQEPAMVAKDDEMSKDKEIKKLMAFKKIYKPTNNNLRTSSNTSRANQDNTPRINRGTGYDNQRVVNVDGARENVGTQVVQQSGI
nr:hypothetical protein [Tanacetum cinerariifolium]